MSYHKLLYVAIIKAMAMITKNCFIATRKHYKLNSGRLSGKVAKNLPDNAGDTGETGSIPISRRSPGEGYGNPLQYSGLENPMDRQAWKALLHRVAKCQTQLSG